MSVAAPDGNIEPRLVAGRVNGNVFGEQERKRRVHGREGATPESQNVGGPPSGMDASPRRTVAQLVVGMAVAILCLGPALRPGSLLGLDLVFPPRVAMPTGLWGLGPALPRRLPIGALVSLLSAVAGGAAAGKLLLCACLVAGFVGVARLTADARVGVWVGAGLLYTLNPFTLTRLTVGHWTVLAAWAALPWTLPSLLAEDADRSRFARAAVVMGLTGFVGGTLSGVVVAVRIARTRTDAAWCLVRWLPAQIPWLAPGAVVAITNPPHRAGSSAFVTDARGVPGLLRVVAGQGFWRHPSQIGPHGAGVAIIGGVLLLLALAGERSLAPNIRRSMAVVALSGFVIAVAPTLPGLGTVFDWLASTAVGGPLREAQRALPLFLVWLAPAAAIGTARLFPGRQAALAGVVVATVAAVTTLGGLWGAGGRITPLRFPPEWSRARAIVQDRAGPVLALPWHQYMNVSFDGGRRTLDPLPDFFGGDVVSNSDPELAEGAREVADSREHALSMKLELVRRGEMQGRVLAENGIRWLVVRHEADWRAYAALWHDPLLVNRVHGPTLDLLEVVPWRGYAVSERGTPLRSHSVLPPMRVVARSGPAVVARSASSGWLRGWRRAGKTADGQLRLPAGGGLVWYWPALFVVGAEVAWLFFASWLVLNKYGKPLQGWLVLVRLRCTVGDRARERALFEEDAL